MVSAMAGDMNVSAAGDVNSECDNVVVKTFSALLKYSFWSSGCHLALTPSLASPWNSRKKRAMTIERL